MVEVTQTATLEQGIENFDTSTDELVLRVCSPARRGQIVRLRSHKCTIGSARSCTLRLNARGVQPVHCLIMRGQNATVIRCWTPDTRINGRSFTDANLNFGDRLTIGPIEFEVLNTGTSHVQAEPQPDFLEREDTTGFLDDKKQWERDRESQREDLDRQRRQWQTERDSQEQRLRQANDNLAAKTAELERLKENLRQDRGQLDAQTETLRQDREQLDAQAETLRQDRERLDEPTKALRQDREQLDVQAKTLQQDREQLDAQAETLRQDRGQLDAQAETLQQDREQLDAQAETLRQDREQLDVQAETLLQNREQLTAQAETLRQYREQLDAQAETFQQDREAFDAQVEMPRTEITGNVPVIQDETPERVDAKCVDEEQTQPEKLEEVSLRPSDNRDEQSEEAVRIESTKDDNDEESLDSYMARLLDRVRSVSGPANAPATAKKSVSRPSPSAKQPVSAPRAAKPQAEVEQTATTVDHPRSAPEKLKDLSPRGVAPERAMSLSSMRELANVSAQTAINRHAKRQFRHAARSKLLVAGIGLVAGGILMYLWWFMGDRGPIFYAGLVPQITINGPHQVVFT